MGRKPEQSGWASVKSTMKNDHRLVSRETSRNRRRHRLEMGRWDDIETESASTHLNHSVRHPKLFILLFSLLPPFPLLFSLSIRFSSSPLSIFYNHQYHSVICFFFTSLFIILCISSLPFPSNLSLSVCLSVSVSLSLSLSLTFCLSFSLSLLLFLSPSLIPPFSFFQS